MYCAYYDVGWLFTVIVISHGMELCVWGGGSVYQQVVILAEMSTGSDG